jgi:hypothetical protein
MIPSRQVIALRPAGRVLSSGQPERSVTIKQPAVASILCEGTERIYYWVNRGQTFREFVSKE